MAISVIGNEEKTSSGAITIPANTILVIAAVEGSDMPPTIDGVAMGAISTITAQGIIPACGIFEYTPPSVGVKNMVFSGNSVNFAYIIAYGHRKGSINGYNADGIYTGDMVTASGDLVFGILRGSIGPTTMKGDEVEMTYIKDSTLLKVGYIFAGAALITCLASDTGVSEGYWADGGSYWVPGSYIPGYYTYPQFWQPGYYVQSVKWIPAHWQYYPPPPKWIEGKWETVYIWIDGYWYTDPTWHPPVTVDGHWEDYDDIWVPPGPSQISACFCSIREYEEGVFIPKSVYFN